MVALTSGGNGDVEAGADGSSFSDDPAWKQFDKTCLAGTDSEGLNYGKISCTSKQTEIAHIGRYKLAPYRS